jgi:hypothetical protein
MQKSKYILTLLLLVLCFACANIGTPDGGPFDETPPRVVNTTPKFGATKTKSTKIVLEFDENIKVSGANEKIIVSPPQVEQPEIEAMGKKITVELLDSIKPNTTYTIDFSDAIQDNNEGNPMGDYAFTFSTGDKIDTMQMSGYVLDASNLEPIKGILVGLYAIDNDSAYVPKEGSSLNPDTLLRHKVFERISRSDSRGHFIIKGIEAGRKYKVYALQDQNQNYVYDQKSEMIAFTDRIVTPSSAPDIRMDTIWHDSIYYDSIVSVNYTHFYPDDIVLLAFGDIGKDRFLIKSERQILNKFSIFFSAPHDSLPVIEGLNFDVDNAFVIDKNEKNDTLHYWIRDSLIYNIDTLLMSLTYYATDTLGQLSPKTDTLQLVSKLTKERMRKEREKAEEEWAEEYREKYKEEQKRLEREARRAGNDEGAGEENKKSKKKAKINDEDIVIPPMPEEFLIINLSNTSSMDPNMNIDFTMPEPIESIDTSKIHFFIKQDSVLTPAPFLLRKIDEGALKYRFYAEWEPDTKYELAIDTGAFVNIYGKRSQQIKRGVNIKSLDAYSTLFVTLQGDYPNAIVQLINTSDKVYKSVKANSGNADFYFVKPGTYYLRMIDDTNGNGIWDTGNYDKHLQAERVFYYPGSLNLKAQWDISQEWNPETAEIYKQKPAKITKQKPDKERKRVSKNAEREKQKRK